MRAMKERRKKDEEEKKTLMKTRKLTREMAAEETFKRRMTRSMSQVHVAIENEIGGNLQSLFDRNRTQ